jgi:hypothetical protein
MCRPSVIFVVSPIAVAVDTRCAREYVASYQLDDAALAASAASAVHATANNNAKRQPALTRNMVRNPSLNWTQL